MKTPQLLTCDDVAAAIGVTPHAFRQMRYRGEGPPALKIGRRLRFRPADVDKWLEDCAEASG